MRAVVLVLAVLLAVLRMGGATHPAFQAAAHLFVGSLLGAAWAAGWRVFRGWSKAEFELGVAIVLSLVELTVAIAQRIGG